MIYRAEQTIGRPPEHTNSLPAHAALSFIVDGGDRWQGMAELAGYQQEWIWSHFSWRGMAAPRQQTSRLLLLSTKHSGQRNKLILTICLRLSLTHLGILRKEKPKWNHQNQTPPWLP